MARLQGQTVPFVSNQIGSESFDINELGGNRQFIVIFAETQSRILIERNIK